MSGKRCRTPIPLILIILLLPALGFTGWKVWSMMHQAREEADAFRNLAAIVAEEEQAAAGYAKQKSPSTAVMSGNEMIEGEQHADIQEGTASNTVSDAVETGNKSNTVSNSSIANWKSDGDETEIVAVKNELRNTNSASLNSEELEEIQTTTDTLQQRLESERTEAVLKEESQSAEQTEMPEREILPQYRKLHEMNPDLFGWLRIEGTIIDYPVMYTPEDPEFYLRRGFDREYAYSGTPFMEGHCDPEGNYYIIYAHHMKDENMFHNLPDYEKKAYWQEHPVIQLDTMYEKREYEVIAAFRSQLYEVKTTGVFKYYEYTDLRDPGLFEEYMNGVRAEALYDTGLDAEYGDELLALSTCNYHTTNGRFVVVAKRIMEAEEE